MRSPNHQADPALSRYSPASDYSLQSWKIDPEMLSPQARGLWERENSVPVTIAEDTSLRPKILDACGMTCVFCHNEGTPVASEAKLNGKAAAHSLGRVSIYSSSNGVNFLPGRMRPDQKLYDALGALHQAVDVDEIHLTGGEPTLHPELPAIIELSKSLGMSVKMTSNGENPKAFEKCAEAGLDRVIFSVFGVNAQELSMVQHSKYQNPKLAQRKIDALHRSIDTTGEHGIKATANVVIPGAGHEQRVVGIIERFDNLSLRLLNSLDDGEASYAAIYEILARLGAEPVETKLTAGSSNARINYRLPNDSEISFKQIRPARFNHICDGCQIDKQGKCEESFYGLRLYVDENDQYLVGLCIQRMDLAMHLEEFLASDIPERIRSYRAAEKTKMESYFHGSSV
jgi:molybdenum cofactor biosynthesis enzyme MoaA